MNNKQYLGSLIYIFGLLGGVILFVYSFATQWVFGSALSLFIYMVCTEIYNKYRKD